MRDDVVDEVENGQVSEEVCDNVLGGDVGWRDIQTHDGDDEPD